MIKYNIDQGSEAWFSARCGRVTGTRFKALMAGHSTVTYKDLIADMTCEIITGKMEEGFVNAAMEHGIETEPKARQEYETMFDVSVEEVGFIIPEEDNKYHDWIGVSPDGLVGDGLLEIKCPKMKTHLGYIAGRKLPTEYRYQVQGQLFVTGLQFCDFMSYVEGMKPFIVRVYPDPEIFKEFEQRLNDVIKLVQMYLNEYEKYDYYE